MRLTYHLVPAAEWAAAAGAPAYAAPSLADEGFIHCTDGEAEVLATGDRHYRSDGRPYVVLTIDLDEVGVPWRTDDPVRTFPHVFGAIPRSAVLAVHSVERAPDGSFLAIGTAFAEGWTPTE